MQEGTKLDFRERPKTQTKVSNPRNYTYAYGAKYLAVACAAGLTD